MAKKASGASVVERGISAGELKKFFETRDKMAATMDANKAKLDDFETTTRKRHHLDKTAMGWITKLRKSKEERRQPVIRAFFEYCHKLGYFDQVDGFDDLIGHFKQIIADAEVRTTTKAADDDAFDGVDDDDEAEKPAPKSKAGKAAAKKKAPAKQAAPEKATASAAPQDPIKSAADRAEARLN